MKQFMVLLFTKNIVLKVSLIDGNGKTRNWSENLKRKSREQTILII